MALECVGHGGTWLLYGSWRKGCNIVSKLNMPHPAPSLTSISAKCKTEAQRHHPLSEPPEFFSAGIEYQSHSLGFSTDSILTFSNGLAGGWSVPIHTTWTASLF